MNTTAPLLLMAILAALSPSAHFAAASDSTAPFLQVKVDPRVELLSLIFRLAGNPEYSQGKVASYTQDADQQFGSFRNHAVVSLAKELRRTRGVSYDAVMSLAVHLKDIEGLHLAVPLDPWPEDLDHRWSWDSVNNFLDAARQFLRDTGFKKFLEQHQKLYQTTATRMQTMLEESAHLEWYQSYFGERPSASFTAVPGLLNGGSCYGARCRQHPDCAGSRGSGRHIPAHRHPIDPQFTGNPAFGPALLVEGDYRLLLIHFELIHRPAASQKANPQGQRLTSRAGDFEPANGG